MNESLARTFELIQEEENGLEEEEAEEGEDPGDMFNLDAGRKFLLNYNHPAIHHFIILSIVMIPQTGSKIIPSTGSRIKPTSVYVTRMSTVYTTVVGFIKCPH